MLEDKKIFTSGFLVKLYTLNFGRLERDGCLASWLWADHVVGWHRISASPQRFPGVGKNVILHAWTKWPHSPIFCRSFPWTRLANQVLARCTQAEGQGMYFCRDSVRCNVPSPLAHFKANYFWCRFPNEQANPVIYNNARGKTPPCEENMGEETLRDF